MALHPYVVRFLYSRDRRRRICSDPRDADAAEDCLLYPYDSNVPDGGAEGSK